ncbi:MC family transporter [Cyclospora cayetanensis]|uniref:MC family transporter n=1 Tax=Cyclospora cayetanensis TaxID=88456 RepID=A0A1D3D3L9_9EIME|nr:MC family transporter [Cyclospora cayetanensis]
MSSTHSSPPSEATSKAASPASTRASAQVINVLSFMWLRTTMNYQYRHGGSTTHVVKTLWKEGGVPRFYRGLLPALLQSPLSRFGDTASNVGVLTLLDANERTRDLPVGLKTALASCGAACWRLFLMPIDAWKTTKQVEGGDGLKQLTQKGKSPNIL